MTMQYKGDPRQLPPIKAPTRDRLLYVTNNYFAIPEVYKPEYSRIYLEIVSPEAVRTTMNDGRIKGHTIIWVNSRDAGQLLAGDKDLACSFRAPLDSYNIEPTVIITGYWGDR